MDAARTPLPGCRWARRCSTPPSSGNLKRPTGMRSCRSSAPPPSPPTPTPSQAQLPDPVRSSSPCQPDSNVPMTQLQCTLSSVFGLLAQSTVVHSSSQASMHSKGRDFKVQEQHLLNMVLVTLLSCYYLCVYICCSFPAFLYGSLDDKKYCIG